MPIPLQHHVPGTLKCYSLECFQAIGGIQERLGWDTIDETYARMRGYRTQAFQDLVAHHHRPWGSADGTLRGRARHGRCAYIVQFPLPWVTLRAFKVARTRPRGLSGVAFLYGYLRAAARRRGARRRPRLPELLPAASFAAVSRDAFTSSHLRRAPKPCPLADGER